MLLLRENFQLYFHRKGSINVSTLAWKETPRDVAWRFPMFPELCIEPNKKLDSSESFPLFRGRTARRVLREWSSSGEKRDGKQPTKTSLGCFSSNPFDTARVSVVRRRWPDSPLRRLSVRSKMQFVRFGDFLFETFNSTVDAFQTFTS